jgi:hypothetical protein
VIYEGRIVGEIGEPFDAETVGLMMAGHHGTVA